MQAITLAFDGFGSLRNLRNLACRLCLWSFIDSEILGIAGILRADCVSGM